MRLIFIFDRVRVLRVDWVLGLGVLVLRLKYIILIKEYNLKRYYYDDYLNKVI